MQKTAPAFSASQRALVARTGASTVLVAATLAAAMVASAQESSGPPPPAGANVIVIVPDSLATTPRSLSELLRDYVPSASVQRSTGALGGSSWVSLRDASVIRGDDPLVVIDGTRQVSYRTGLDTLNRRSTSILDDLMIDDVARVEVLNGPAAASMYGYDGQRGAIVVTTRGPGSGRPVFRASVTTSSAGANADYARNLSGVTAAGRPCPYFVEALGSCAATSTSRYTPLLDRSPFRSGQQAGLHLGVTGGLGPLGYAASLGSERGTGTMKANAADRTVASLRLGLSLSPAVRIGLASFATGRGLSTPAEGDGSVIARGVGGGPIDCSPATPCGYDSVSGGYRIAPLAVLERRGPHRRIGRLGEAVTVDVAVASNLSLRTSVTADMLRDEASMLDSSSGAYGRRYWRTSSSERNWRVGGSEEGRLTTRLGTAVATTRLSVRFDAERSRDESDTKFGSRLSTPSQPGDLASVRWAAWGLRRDRLQTSLDQRFTWGDRASLGVGAMRTTTGWWTGHPDLPAVIDPRADAMYQVVPATSPLGMLTSLRLRSAWGRASGHDGRRSINRVDFDLVPIGSGTIGSGTQPPPKYRPHRSTEAEGGLDAVFVPASTRISLTAFRRRETISDPSLSFSVSGNPNAVVTRQVTGGEIVAEATPIDAGSVRLHLRGQLALSRDRVGGVIFPFLLFPGNTDVKLAVTNGESWAAWRTRAYDWNDANANGRIELAEIQYANYSAPNGRSRPSRVASLRSALEIARSFTLSAVLDYAGGFDVYDRTAAVQCLRGACPALNDPTAVLSDQARSVAAADGSLDAAGFLVPGDAARLRELALTGQSARAAALLRASAVRVSLAAYDVATWSRSRGVHPETDMPAPGAVTGLGSLVQPIPRTFALRVALTY